jgi:hypothetical protein
MTRAQSYQSAAPHNNERDLDYFCAGVAGGFWAGVCCAGAGV